MSQESAVSTDAVANIAKRVGLLDSLQSIGKLVTWCIRAARAFVMLIPNLWIFFWSLGMLLLLALIIILIIILIIKINPRIPQMFHTSSMDRDLDALVSDIESRLNVLVNHSADGEWMLQHKEIREQHQAVKTALEGFLVGSGGGLEVKSYEGDPYNGDLLESLKSYYKFYKSIRQFNCIYKSDLRNNMPEINDADGDPDRKPFLESFIIPLDDLKTSLTDLSNALHDVGEFSNLVPPPNKLGPEHVLYVTAVHELRMMLDQRSAITAMCMTRRSNLPMAIWTEYYAPLVVNMITKRIPAFWMRFPQRYMSMMDLALQTWLKIGSLIVSLPCYLAFPDPIERSRMCRSPENFEAFQGQSPFFPHLHK